MNFLSVLDVFSADCTQCYFVFSQDKETLGAEPVSLTHHLHITTWPFQAANFLSFQAAPFQALLIHFPNVFDLFKHFSNYFAVLDHVITASDSNCFLQDLHTPYTFGSLS